MVAGNSLSNVPTSERRGSEAHISLERCSAGVECTFVSVIVIEEKEPDSNREEYLCKNNGYYSACAHVEQAASCLLWDKVKKDRCETRTLVSHKYTHRRHVEPSADMPL